MKLDNGLNVDIRKKPWSKLRRDIEKVSPGSGKLLVDNMKKHSTVIVIQTGWNNPKVSSTNLIWSIFTWSHTPEGHDFWAKVSKDLSREKL